MQPKDVTKKNAARDNYIYNIHYDDTAKKQDTTQKPTPKIQGSVKPMPQIQGSIKAEQKIQESIKSTPQIQVGVKATTQQTKPPNDIQNTMPMPQINSKKISYKYAGRETLAEIIRKYVPKQFVPTKAMNTAFGIIFILVLIISLIQPLGQMMSGNIDLTISIGYPIHFLELEMKESTANPIKPLGLILDILIYILLAYIINVIINLIMDTSIVQTEEERKHYPKVFKDQKQSFSDSATKRFIRKLGLDD